MGAVGSVGVVMGSASLELERESQYRRVWRTSPQSHV